MPNISITGSDKITILETPNTTSGAIGGTLNISACTDLHELRDRFGNEFLDVEGFSTSSSLEIFDFESSNARLPNDFLANGVPPLLREFHLDSNFSTISGNLPTLPTTMQKFILVGNQNQITGGIPKAALESGSGAGNYTHFKIIGNKMDFSGGSASDSFLPTTLDGSVRHFMVGNEGNQNLCSHEGVHPIIQNSLFLEDFNIVGMKLHGALPTLMPANLETYKIGGKGNQGTYHAGLNSNQAFPSFENCNQIHQVTMINLKNGVQNPKITSCATDVFDDALFPNNSIIDLRFNAFSATVTADILTAIKNATGSSSAATGRVIKLQGNRPPSDLTSMSGGTVGSADTGNTSINYLLNNNWSIEFNTDAPWAASNWPA